MTTIVYPSSLPGPSAAAVQLAERRTLSPDGGPFDTRAFERDRRAIQDVTLPPFTATEMATFVSWFDDDLLDGGAWFAADWPLPQGFVTGVRRWIGNPVRRAIAGGFWQVSGQCAVRGRGMNPQLYTSSDVVMLLHMDALPLVDEVGRVVTMHDSGGSISSIAGGKFGNAAYWSAARSGYATMVNDERMDFGAGPGPTFDVWLRELPSTDHDNIVFQVAKSSASGQYGMVCLVANSDGGASRYSVFLSDTTAGNAFLGGSYALYSGALRPVGSSDSYRHVRFGRCDGTTWKLAVDGLIKSTYTTAPGLLFNGSIGSDHGLTWVGNAAASPPYFIGNNFSGGPIDELVARKRWMDMADFTPPATRFEYP